jgi:type IV pilus assembly protein PilC
MLLSSRLSLSSIIDLCRALRHNLGAGLMLRDVFRQQARRGSAEVRPVAERMWEAIERGESLRTALKQEQKAFPPLFLALASVGEETGNMPEIFGELEKYYAMQQRFIRQFISQSMLPILQLVAAIFVISGLMYILGFIAETRGGPALEPIGFGLTGARGATIFLFGSFGTMAGLVIAYILISRSLKQKAVVDGLLLGLPAIGPFLRALAMARFTLAMRLTMDSAAPVTASLDLSLKGTGNAYFATRADGVKAALRSGQSVTDALAQTRMFSGDFINIVAVGEESGRLPEVMGQQASFYEEEAGRRLATLTKVGGFMVWGFVAALIVIAIFKIFSLYIGAIESATQGWN